MNGIYQVSNLGRIKRLGHYRKIKPKGYEQTVYYKEKILSPIYTDRYVQLTLCKNGERQLGLVHRLVAEAFIPNPENLPLVNHKDENKHNNCVDNLEWCSHAYNNSYGSRTKRTCKPVKCIETGIVYDSTVQAGKLTGVNRVYITNCCNNKKLSAGGFHWEYVKENEVNI